MSRLRFGRTEVWPRERRLLVDGREATVGTRAFDLLLALIEHRDRLVTKQELLDRVWPQLVVEEANLSVHVAALRKVLGARAIATIPGRGYRFALADGEEAQAVREPAQPVPTASPDASEAIAPAPADARPAPAAPAVDPEPLIGREEEVYDIVALLLEQRMVSIVGAGGIGKTRLARAVQRRLREDFVDGAWWVDLAAAVAGGDVLRTLARTLDAPIADDQGEALAQALAPRSRMLIVLDNCEQVAAAVASIVARLLAALPMLRLLATSRVPLHVAGEQVWRIDALAVPAAGAPLDKARRCGAFELLERRVRAADRRFRFDAAGLPPAVEICRRLDGHPLAIEMAAARVPQIGLAALCERLDQRLKLLRASDPSLPDRQANLRNMLDWSWSLLEPQQRSVLRRLAVFAGSFGLESAQAVAADQAHDAWDVLDALADLVDHSMVQVVADIEPPAPSEAAPLRYRLSATTRLYAMEQLAEAGEAEVCRRSHRRAMGTVADAVDAARWTRDDSASAAAREADHEDLQIAFDDACAGRDAAAAARLGLALAELDRQRGLPGARARRAAAARALLDDAPDALTGARLWDLASTEAPEGKRADDDARRVAAWLECGDRRGLLEALIDQARGLAMAGYGVAAAEVMAEVTRRLLPDDPAIWHLEAAIAAGELAGYRADVEPGADARTAAHLEQLLARHAMQIDATRRARAMLCLAELALAGREAAPDVAMGWADRSLETMDALPHAPARGRAWRARCAALLVAGDTAQARAAAAQALPLLRARLRGATLFDALALLAAREGRAETAARLLGHADRWYDEHRARHGAERRLRELAIGAIAPKAGRLRGGPAATALAEVVAQGYAADAVSAEGWARELLGLAEYD